MARARKVSDRFVALDFETANYSRDSACAVGLVTVVGTEIVDRASFLIRPPQPEAPVPTTFQFCHLHGICRHQVADQPTFLDLWPQLLERLEGADFVAAHNAGFDRDVLTACCEANSLTMPPLRFLCTLQLARSAWKLKPARLSDVCAHLKIPLQHHQVLSDTEACARIVISARRQGVRLDAHILRAETLESPEPAISAGQAGEREIVEQMDRLGALRSRRDNLGDEKQALIDQVFPPEVRTRLAEIDAEFTQKEDALGQDIEVLEGEVKGAVLGLGETVKGRFLLAQWVKGRITWDTKGLNQYGEGHPEILRFQKKGNPYVSLKSVGQYPKDSI